MKSLVIGLGNPIMGDDAIGCRCAQALAEDVEFLKIDEVEVDQFFRGGISLMERLIGYDRVLIIDSINHTGMNPGSITFLSLDDLPSHTTNSPHDGSLKNAIEFGKKMGEKLPDQVDVLAVEIEPKFEFSENLSPVVEAGIGRVKKSALEWILNEGIVLN